MPPMKQDILLAKLGSIEELLTLLYKESLTTRQRLDGIDARLDAMDARFDAIETRLDVIESRLDAIETRLDAVETRLDVIESRLDVIETRLDSIESRLDIVETRLDTIDTVLAVHYEELVYIRNLMGELEVKIIHLEVQSETLEERVDQALEVEPRVYALEQRVAHQKY